MCEDIQLMLIRRRNNRTDRTTIPTFAFVVKTSVCPHKWQQPLMNCSRLVAVFKSVPLLR